MADKTQKTKGVVIQPRKGFIMCGIKNNKIHNAPHMFFRWITRKYGCFTQQRRKFPILFYLHLRFFWITAKNPQLRNQVYHTNQQLFLKFDIFFREYNRHSTSLHRPGLYQAAVGSDSSYLPGRFDPRETGIIESSKLNLYHGSRFFGRTPGSPLHSSQDLHILRSPGRESLNYFSRFFGRTPGSPLHSSQDLNTLRSPGRPTKEKRSFRSHKQGKNSPLGSVHPDLLPYYAANSLINHCNLWVLPLSRGEWAGRAFGKLNIECLKFPSLEGWRRQPPGWVLAATNGRTRFSAANNMTKWSKLFSDKCTSFAEPIRRDSFMRPPLLDFNHVFHGGMDQLELDEPGRKESPAEAVKAPVIAGAGMQEFPFSPGSSIIPRRKKPTFLKNREREKVTKDFRQPGPVSLPSLSYFSPLKNPTPDREPSFAAAGDDFKKTAASGKLMEEIQGENMSGTSGSPGSSRQQNVDLDRLTDQVYRLLERKIRIEKEMRGW